MTATQDTFDFEASDRLKRVGMDRGASAAKTGLQVAREVAEALAWITGAITADDVAEELERLGRSGNLGPAAGSLFKESKWVFTGDRIKSSRKSNHARELKVWRLAR